MTSTVTVSPAAASGSKVPTTRWPLTTVPAPSAMPESRVAARRTVISYVAPRKRRVAVKPGQADGMTGSTLSPSSSGLMPRIH